MSKTKEVHGLDKLSDDILLKRCRFDLGVKESEISELEFKIEKLEQKIASQQQSIDQLKLNAEKHKTKMNENNEIVNAYISGARDEMIREQLYADIVRTSDKNKRLVKEAKRKIESFIGRYNATVNELNKYKQKFGEDL